MNCRHLSHFGMFPFTRLLVLPVCLLLLIAPANLSAQKEKEKAASQGDKEQSKKKVAEKVTGKILVTNKVKIAVDYANAEFVLEERFVPMPPKQLPENWEKLTPEEQEKWAEEFLTTEEGKVYQKLEQERFENRKQFELV